MTREQVTVEEMTKATLRVGLRGKRYAEVYAIVQRPKHHAHDRRTIVTVFNPVTTDVIERTELMGDDMSDMEIKSFANERLRYLTSNPEGVNMGVNTHEEG